MRNKKYRSYTRFTNISLQMIAIIAISAWIGKKIDTYFEISRPWFLISLSLSGTILSVYVVIKKISNKYNNPHNL